MRFHDETHSTKARVISRRLHREAETNPILLSVVPSKIDQYAKSFFTHNYVLIHQGTAGYLSGVARLLVQPSLSSALEAAMVAVGTAGIACKESSPLLELSARKSYGIAIFHINEALKDTVKMNENETLAAILVLGLYEVSDIHTCLYTL